MSEATAVAQPTTIIPDKIRIKLTKNTKGYGWEVSVGGDSADEVQGTLQLIEGWLVENYARDREDEGLDLKALTL